MADEKKDDGFKLTVSADDVRGFIQQALLKALAPETRDKLVAEALRKLLEGSWQQPSDLQRIFAQAACDVARELAKAEMEKPQNAEKLRALVAEAWEKRVIGEDREKLVEKVGDAISRGIFGDRY